MGNIWKLKSTMDELKVGFVGLGRQGALIVEGLLGSPFQLRLWARSAQALDQYRSTRAITAPSLEVLARQSNVVGVCVVKDADVEEVVEGDRGLLASMDPGGIILIHSTVSPELCIRLGVLATERGLTVVDAPVSNSAPRRLATNSIHSVEGVRETAGTMAVMVGCSEGTFVRCRPVLESFGEPVVRVGDLGSGQIAKLIINLVFYSNLGVAHDALELGESVKVDTSALSELLCATSGRSNAVELFARDRILALDKTAGELRSRFGNLVTKDLDLAATISGALENDNVLQATADRAMQLFGIQSDVDVGDGDKS